MKQNTNQGGQGQGGVGGSAGGGTSSLVDNIEQANAEIERLRKLGDKLSGELQGKKGKCNIYSVYHAQQLTSR